MKIYNVESDVAEDWDTLSVMACHSWYVKSFKYNNEGCVVEW